MKIAFLCAKDMAGVMYNLSEAINKHTRHEAFHVVGNLHRVYRFPYQYRMTAENRQMLHEKIYGADAVVFSEWMGLLEMLKLNRKAFRSKKVAVTYGGGGFRLRRARLNGMNYYGGINNNVKYVACSADFLKQAPDLPWVPRVVRTQWLREQYDHSKLEPPLIAASPSFSTDSINLQMGRVSTNFNRITAKLKARRLSFQARLISSSKTGMSNDECLKIKAHASAFFDRLYSIYGVNSLEAAAFESAVITGTNQPALDVIKRHLGMACPFIIRHTWEGVEAAFVELLRNPALMKRKGLECYKYVEALEKYAANRMMKILGG